MILFRMEKQVKPTETSDERWYDSDIIIIFIVITFTY